MHELVVEPARGFVRCPRVPIEPRPAAFAADVDEVLNEGFADAVASRGRIDEQVLQIAELA